MTSRGDDEPGGDIRIPAAVYARIAGDVPAVVAFVELVRRAAWRPGVHVVGAHEVQVSVGDVLTSREAFSNATSLTEDQTRGAWSRLSKLGLITVHGHRHGTQRGTRVTVHHVSCLRESEEPVTHQHPQQNPQHNSQAIPNKTPNTFPNKTPIYVEALSGSSDLGSGIFSSSEPPKGISGERQQGRGGRDPRAEEQRRLVRVIGAAHVTAHARLRVELGFDAAGRKGYVPAMQPVGDPAERALRELVAAQASVEGLDERLRHVLAVGEAEARREGSLRWFGPTLWSQRSYDRAISMAVGEDRRPARAAAQEGPTAQALRRVRELEAMEAEEERRAVDGRAL